MTLAPDADSTKVNPKYIGVILESGSGSIFLAVPGISALDLTHACTRTSKGSFAVIDNSHTGRLNELCTFKGHSAPIIDLEFNPFNDNMIATASDDALVMLWSIPESGPQDASKRPEAELQYHVKKVRSSPCPRRAGCLRQPCSHSPASSPIGNKHTVPPHGERLSSQYVRRPRHSAVGFGEA